MKIPKAVLEKRLQDLKKRVEDLEASYPQWEDFSPYVCEVDDGGPSIYECACEAHHAEIQRAESQITSLGTQIRSLGSEASSLHMSTLEEANLDKTEPDKISNTSMSSDRTLKWLIGRISEEHRSILDDQQEQWLEENPRTVRAKTIMRIVHILAIAPIEDWRNRIISPLKNFWNA